MFPSRITRSRPKRSPIATTQVIDAQSPVLPHDPVVLTHARALLTSTPEGATGY
jgi:hypothetical protein